LFILEALNYSSVKIKGYDRDFLHRRESIAIKKQQMVYRRKAGRVVLKVKCHPGVRSIYPRMALYLEST